MTYETKVPHPVWLWVQFALSIPLMVVGGIGVATAMLTIIFGFPPNNTGFPTWQILVVAIGAVVGLLLPASLKLRVRAEMALSKYHETPLNGTVTHITATATIEGTNAAGKPVTYKVDVPSYLIGRLDIGEKYPWAS